MAGRLHIAPLPLDDLLPGLQLTQPLLTSPNLAPRHVLSMIRLEHDSLQLVSAFWGLTPPWLKVLDHAPHCARAESLDSRPMFHEAFSTRRCLIPVSGVYVWKSLPRMKQPFLVTRTDRGPLLLAGLWSRYPTSLTEYNDSTALITVPTNRFLRPLTDRFAAIIDPLHANVWLDSSTPLAIARQSLVPASLKLLGIFPVSRRVNDPTHQDWACGHPTGAMTCWNSKQEI